MRASTEGTETIESLRAEEWRLAALIGEVQKRRHALECEAAGVTVGDIVIHDGIEHRVTKVDTWANPVWVYGNPKKKDGTFGTRVVHMYGAWSKPK